MSLSAICFSSNSLEPSSCAHAGSQDILHPPPLTKFPSAHACLPAATRSLFDRFEYIIGTHLFFSPTVASVRGSAGAAAAGDRGQLDSGEALPASAEAASGEQSGVHGEAGTSYSFYGKASKKLVFRPVVLNPK